MSLVLNLPNVFGGYPYEEQILERLATSRLRRGFALVPDGLRRRIVERVPRELTAAAVFGGTPSSAHAEALLRAIEFKGATLDEPLDAIVIGIPPTTLFLPRARPNPVAAAQSRPRARAAPLAERLPGAERRHRDPAARLPAPLPRADADALPRALLRPADGARPEALGEAERAATADARGLAEYRAGRTVHPLEPFLAWSACDAVANRLGSVLVAGCRDAAAARQLGFVPVDSVGAALGMARGTRRRRGSASCSRPPYFPLVVAGGERGRRSRATRRGRSCGPARSS